MARLGVLEEVLKKGELYKFLVGQDEYYLAAPLADLPTDPHLVWSALIEYYKKDNSFLEILLEQLDTMSRDPNYCWFVLYYFAGLLRLKKNSNINIDLSPLWNKYQEGIKNNKQFLVNDRRWLGSIWPNGLWGDVERMTKNLKEEFQESFGKEI